MFETYPITGQYYTIDKRSLGAKDILSSSNEVELSRVYIVGKSADNSLCYFSMSGQETVRTTDVDIFYADAITEVDYQAQFISKQVARIHSILETPVELQTPEVDDVLELLISSNLLILRQK